MIYYSKTKKTLHELTELIGSVSVPQKDYIYKNVH